MKAEEGLLQSPTLAQMSRMVLMQILSSKNWVLQLGDIRGAFLEAEPLEERFRPLYAHMPPGGIPGVPPNAVIEVLGNLYGQNNAPSAWYRTFNQEIKALGWKVSSFDNCGSGGSVAVSFVDVSTARMPMAPYTCPCQMLPTKSDQLTFLKVPIPKSF